MWMRIYSSLCERANDPCCSDGTHVRLSKKMTTKAMKPTKEILADDVTDLTPDAVVEPYWFWTDGQHIFFLVINPHS